jgi:hypothetical protein
MTRRPLLGGDQSVALGGLMLQAFGNFYGRRDPASLHRLLPTRPAVTKAAPTKQPDYRNAMGVTPVFRCYTSAQGQDAWLH